MKVIFLDVDGVINSRNNIRRNAQLKRTCETMYFAPMCMRLLKKLVQNTGAKLVLSSDWRFPDPRTYSVCRLQNLIARLADYELGLISQSGEARFCRDEEISAWLQKHPEVTSHVILGDANDNFQHENLRRLVLADEIVGLTLNDIQKAEKILEE